MRAISKLNMTGHAQVEHALRRQSGMAQLPEVWELLYKVARDMSRAAGAEELVNSLQTAAESYLVVSHHDNAECHGASPAAASSSDQDCKPQAQLQSHNTRI